MKNRLTEIHYLDSDSQVELGMIRPGTMLRGVKGHPDTLYMKLDRGNLTIHETFCNNYSLILNVYSGKVRAVGKDTLVFPLSCSINASHIDRDDLHLALKSNYRDL